MRNKNQFQLYQDFIVYCTTNSKSVRNYSDFKRINECLELLHPDKQGISVLDFDDPVEFKKIIDELLKQKQFIEYDRNGNNQYSNTLKHYLRFLFAKKLFYNAPKIVENKILPATDFPLQRIFYGAPGTGKSYAIKKLTEGKNVIRTTFHPDSDYSTFVGAYKPTTKQVPVFSTYGEKAVAVKGADGQQITEDRIIYEFVDQAFLQAYTNAWKLYAQAVKEGRQPEEQYLIIEEINRGNCAQIFGDLFQLLDRDEEGFSEYPIKADKDMKKYLDSVFTNMVFLNAPALCGMNSEETAVKIRKGEILVLPSNLYIWATMNTSDQSLFPIDSAFKRRWDWEYVPIHNCNKGWRIAVNNDEYDWWDFLEKINEQIGSTTNSEDKKLGYFFCKADNDGIISAEKFVSKVIFYLWNDVFKDFGFDSNIFKDEDGKELSFNKFYTTDADGNTAVQRDKVELFLKNLGIEVLNKEDNTGNNNE